MDANRKLSQTNTQTKSTEQHTCRKFFRQVMNNKYMFCFLFYTQVHNFGAAVHADGIGLFVKGSWRLWDTNLTSSVKFYIFSISISDSSGNWSVYPRPSCHLCHGDAEDSLISYFTRSWKLEIYQSVIISLWTFVRDMCKLRIYGGEQNGYKTIQRPQTVPPRETICMY